MKPNKALQSTQAPQTTSNAKQGKKVQNSPISGLCGGDNALRTKQLINGLYNYSVIRYEFSIRHRMQARGCDLLLMIMNRWIYNNEASSVYSLAYGVKESTVTGTATTVARLLERGLIEVMGHGHRNCRLYIPTSSAVMEFESIRYAKTA